MIDVSTGRYHYEIEVDNAQEAKNNLRRVHDYIMNVAQDAHSTKSSSKLLLMLDDCWENIDAISEAIEPLSDDRKALIFHLFEHRMIDAFEAAQAAHEIKSPNRSRGGVKHSDSVMIDEAILAEVERARMHGGPVDLGNAARALEAQGISREWRSLHRRMIRMGVVLPTTAKSAVSSSARQS